MQILHDDGSIDSRYTFNREYCGYAFPVIVVRFCGEFIGACRREDGAQEIADAHNKDR